MTKNLTPNCTPKRKTGFLEVLGPLVGWESDYGNLRNIRIARGILKWAIGLPNEQK